jgi:formyltetrahydrofolate synthetase
VDKRDKWDVKNKGYLKIHVAVNVKTKKILSIKVTNEHVHDSKALPELIENIIKLNSMTTAIYKLFADGTHEGIEVLDIRETMELCHALK